MAGAGTSAALKTLQWALRSVQLACAALILGIYSYFLATITNHKLPIAVGVRAVEGISGFGVLYALASLLLLCCLAGFMLTSFVAMLLDVAFIGAFIYVAVANGGGAGTCSGYLHTPFGKGKSGDGPDADGGFTALPSFHTACKLQTACLAVSIIVIFFFIFSILTEFALARHHQREKRLGLSPEDDPKNTSIFSRLFRRDRGAASATEGESILPEHTTPDQLDAGGSIHQHPAMQEQQLYGGQYQHDSGYPGANFDNVSDTAYHGAGGGHGDVYEAPTTHMGYPTAGYGVGRNTGYQPTPQDFHYDDGIYDRV